MDRQHERPARAWLEIDLAALRRNAAALSLQAGVPLLPMIKADGYGLGAIPVARALEPLDPWGYGVATVDEGRELREAGIERRIVAFTPPIGDDLALARRHRLTPTLSERAAIEEWTAGGSDPWHLAIDTGMSRAGVRWDEIESLHDLVTRTPPEGAFTHFHSAERNDGSVQEQERRFRQALRGLPRPALLHTENSAAIVRQGRSAWDLIRPGVFLYGVGSGEGAAIEPEPVVRLLARVVDLRWVEPGETVSYSASYQAAGRRRIATLAVGYADGYRRNLGNRGRAMIGDRAACVTGVVTMDMTMIDVTGIECAIGDVATLIGGTGAVAVEEVARAGDLSPYELLTGLRGRLLRVYAASA